MSNFRALLPEVNTFIFDYDGVMTDGTVYMDSNGDPLRTSNVKDGYALQLAAKLGYNVAVISGAISTNIENAYIRLAFRMFLRVCPTK